MKIQLSQTVNPGTVYYPYFENGAEWNPRLPDFTEKNLSRDLPYFTGKGKSVQYYSQNLETIVIHLGNRSQFNPDVIRQYGYFVYKQAKQAIKPDIQVVLPLTADPAESELFLKYFIEGFLLSDYQYRDFLSAKTPRFEISSLTVYYTHAVDFPSVLSRIETVTQAVKRVRDLVNGPANRVNIGYLETYCRKISQENSLTIMVKDEEMLRKEGFNLILAVGQGAAEKPRLVEMQYRTNPDAPHICLVGKGVIFDTGGLNIKTENHMNDMKQDMAGGALAIGLIDAVSRLKLNVNVTALIPLVENAVDANSYRPGDIITGYNKKTVEILNTDAEGRLILADTLSYSDKLNADITMDFATLTGAAVVALGTKMGAVFFRDAVVRDQVFESSRKTGEPLWELPLFEPYREHIAGEISDLGNIGNPPRQAGTIMGALFLSEFIENARWAHFDIAGPAFFDREYYYLPKGATGFLLRTILDFIENYRK